MAGAKSIFASSRAFAQNSAATGYIYDSRCLRHPHSTESPQRLEWLHEYVQKHLFDSITQLDLHTTNTQQHIQRVHTSDHYNSVSDIPDTGLAANLAVAGAIGAVDAVHNGSVDNAFCAIRPPGHHAHNNGGEEGFCFYNNVAVAAMYAREVLGYERIVIVDWDYHHGNATQDFFLDDSQVLFLSTHNQFDYPGTGDPAITGTGAAEGYNINVHLDCNATASDISTAWDEKLIPKCESFNPELILISAGFDSKENDALGCFSVTPQGFYTLTKKLMQLADTYCNGKIVSMLEGGYADADSPYNARTYFGLRHSGGAHIAALSGIEMPPTSLKRPENYNSVSIHSTNGTPLFSFHGNVLSVECPATILPATVMLMDYSGRRISSRTLHARHSSIPLDNELHAHRKYIARIKDAYGRQHSFSFYYPNG
jgi:acetoin utilization deacetylase AcuC-like enzyme